MDDDAATTVTAGAAIAGPVAGAGPGAPARRPDRLRYLPAVVLVIMAGLAFWIPLRELPEPQIYDVWHPQIEKAAVATPEAQPSPTPPSANKYSAAAALGTRAGAFPAGVPASPSDVPDPEPGDAGYRTVLAPNGGWVFGRP